MQKLQIPSASALVIQRCPYRWPMKSPVYEHMAATDKSAMGGEQFFSHFKSLRLSFEVSG